MIIEADTLAQILALLLALIAVGFGVLFALDAHKLLSAKLEQFARWMRGE